MIACSKCGMQIPEDSKFCFSCGKKNDFKQLTCPKCGKPINQDSKFCSNCGNPLVQSTTIETTSQVKPTKPIRPIVCELCGGNNLVKEKGFFVCQHCGTKYSLEEARKMMIEGTVQVAGTVRVDNSGKIGNFLMMAKSAFEVKNYKEAEEYANKVIEIDPQNAEAWFIKGKAAGWQSTLSNIRLSESVQCWGNTIQHSGNKRSKYQEEIANEISELDSIIVNLKAESFAESPTDFNAKGLMNALLILDINRNLQAKTQITIEEKTWREFIASSMYNAAVQGFETANAYFGTQAKDRMTFKYQTWLNYVDNCINILASAMDLAETDALLMNCYNNAIRLEKSAINSKTFAFNGQAYVVDQFLTKQSISGRKKIIKEITASKNMNMQRINAQRSR